MVINNLIFFIIALFTAIHLIGHYFKIAWLVYLFKPLSTIAILLYAGQLPTSHICVILPHLRVIFPLPHTLLSFFHSCCSAVSFGVQFANI